MRADEFAYRIGHELQVGPTIASRLATDGLQGPPATRKGPVKVAEVVSIVPHMVVCFIHDTSDVEKISAACSL
jgi:hypothetical protein